MEKPSRARSEGAKQRAEMRTADVEFAGGGASSGREKSDLGELLASLKERLAIVAREIAEAERLPTGMNEALLGNLKARETDLISKIAEIEKPTIN